MNVEINLQTISAKDSQLLLKKQVKMYGEIHILHIL